LGRFKGCIELSSDQIVSIGGDYMRRSIVELPPDREKTQLEIDEEAYAAALRLLVDDLTAGRLVAKCRAVALGASSPSFQFPADGWDEDWKLIVDGKNAVLVDDTGARYKLLSLQAASVELQPAVVSAVPEGNVTSAKKVRGPSTDDQPYHVMMETLMRERRARSPWGAAKILVDTDKRVPLKGATADSVIKRLCRGYTKSGRPSTIPAALTNAPVTQK
jgi:hypothetical protein